MSSGAEDIVIALYDYQANDKEELTIRKNEQLTLIDNTGTWYKVRNKANMVGLVPSNYVKVEKSKGESLVNRIANRFPKRGKGGGSSASTVGSQSQRQQGLQNNSHSNNLDGVGKKSSTGIEPMTMNESYVAKYTYASNQADELSLVKGMNVIVLAKEADGWWQGKNSDGQIGWFPSNYVEQSSAGDASQTVYPPRTVLEVARAIYPFDSGNTEELAFKKGDMFDIIDKPESDPEWYEARDVNGQVGLVPINYIETVPGVSSIFKSESSSYDDVSGDSFNGMSYPSPASSGNGDSQQSMKTKPWYFGPVKRTEAESLLRTRARNSEFIVRDSESTAGDLSVSMKAPDKIKHFKVSYREGKYCIGQRKFDSVDSLIEHYRRAPIYTAPEVGKIYLGQPVAR